MITTLFLLYQDENAQGLVEYALLLTIIALAVMSALNFVGCRLERSFFLTALQIPSR